MSTPQVQESSATELFPHFYVKVEGTNYKVFKEARSTDAKYYLRLWRNGRAIKRSLKTNLQPIAELRAKPLILVHRAGVPLEVWEQWRDRELDLKRLLALAAAGSWAEINEAIGHVPQKKVATLGQLFEVWESMPMDIGEKHRRNVPLAVKRVLRLARPELAAEPAALEALRCEVWNADLIARWRDGVLQGVQGDSQEQATRSKYSANRDMQVALCFWKPVVLAAFRRCGMVLPADDYFAAVARAVKVNRFRKVGRPPYNAPRDEVVAATLAQWRQKSKSGEGQRNEFVAIGLMLAFGLRKGEVAQARGGWLTSIEGQPFMDSSKVNVKSGSGIIQARALDPFYSQLMEGMRSNGWGVKPEEFLIQGTDTERCEEVFNRISKWMRGLGWETVKTNHVMRDYAGSQVCMRYGLEKASTWLRHSNVKVTQDHYTDFVKRHAMEAEMVPVKWATGG